MLHKFTLISLVLVATSAIAQEDVDCEKCVDTADIAKQAVTGSRIQSGAVTTGKIKGRAVTKEKIAPGAISTGKIVDGAVTVSKVAPELSNAIDTYCPLGEVVAGVDESGNLYCESIPYSLDAEQFTSSDDGTVVAVCPQDTVLTGVGCACTTAWGSRNIGVLSQCDMSSNAGQASCLAEASTFNPMLGVPVAELTLSCATTEEDDIILLSVEATSTATGLGDLEEASELYQRRDSALQTLQLQIDALMNSKR